jgi:hypothetical protein
MIKPLMKVISENHNTGCYSIPARQGLVPSEFSYGYFFGNVVGEGNACVSSY